MNYFDIAFRTLVPVLGYQGLMMCINRRYAGFYPFFVVNTIIVLFYFSALLGIDLRVISRVVIICGWISWFGMFIGLIKRRIYIYDIYQPALVLFIVLSTALLPYYFGQSFSRWDEFSHWGLASKNLIITSKLPGNISAVTFKTYPPGVNLFHAFICGNSGFNEGCCYYAHFLLLLTPVCSMIAGVSWRRWYVLVMIIAFGYYVVLELGHGFLSLYVDHLLSMYFCAAVVYILLIKSVVWRFVLLAPVLAVMPIIKQPVGIILASVVVIVAFMFDEGASVLSSANVRS